MLISLFLLKKLNDKHMITYEPGGDLNLLLVKAGGVANFTFNSTDGQRSIPLPWSYGNGNFFLEAVLGTLRHTIPEGASLRVRGFREGQLAALEKVIGQFGLALEPVRVQSSGQYFENRDYTPWLGSYR